MRRPLLALVLALAATASSAGYQRVGPAARVEGEGFCPGRAPCVVPALGGGFPLPYLVDDPQVSVPNALSVPEDDLRWGPFAVDLAAYFAVALGALTLAGRGGLGRVGAGPRPAGPRRRRGDPITGGGRGR